MNKRIKEIGIIVLLLMAMGFKIFRVDAQTLKTTHWYEKVEESAPIVDIRNALELVDSATLQYQDIITFALRAKADSVKLMSPFRSLMTNLVDDIWVASYRLKEMDKSIISWRYVTYSGAETDQGNGPRWRGALAAENYPVSKSLKGQIMEEELHSEVLNETRKLSVYLPPNHSKDKKYPVLYTVDGAEITPLMKRIDSLISSGELKPMLIIGAHTSGYLGPFKPDFSDYDPMRDLRSREYNKGFLSFIGLEGEDSLYTNHMRFFAHELSSWAEERYGASEKKESKLVSGSSNGGSFVASLTTAWPELYGAAMLNSISWEMSVDSLVGSAEDYPKFYFSAGRYEPGFLENTATIADKIKAFGAKVEMSKRLAGHDADMWDEEIINSLKKYFGSYAYPAEAIETLEALHAKDQEKRVLLNSISKKMEMARKTSGADSKAFKALNVEHEAMKEEMVAQDGINTAKFERIVSKYGWPDINRSSELANKAAFFIVQHNFDIQEKYLPLILESANKGQTPGKWVAFLQDRMNMFKRQEQIYGTQLLTINGKHMIWPIQDDENVDKRRSKLGMRPLSEVLQESYSIKYERLTLDDMPQMTFSTPKKSRN